MSAGDDDDLEGDDKLTAMRTVWLSMRDEEPSDKGLAALMAAAREKADELKAPAPTFWQKVLATFRRPPVLALASVTILLGGALVIANRKDKAVAEQTASAPAKDTAPPTIDVEVQAKDPSGSDRDSFGTDASAAGSAAAAETPTVRENAAPATPKPTTEPAKPRPAREKAPERKLDDVKATQSDAGKKAEAPPPPPPPPPPEPEPTVAADKPTVTPTAPITRGPQQKPPAQDPSPGGVIGGAGTSLDAETTSIRGQEDESRDAQRESRVLQMVKQCESAAARGDCAAVKLLAAKIRSQDAATYKARVVKNASIARCLE